MSPQTPFVRPVAPEARPTTTIVLIFALATCLAGPAAAARLVVLSWDGAPDWVIDRLLAEGELPHLARLAAQGATAEHSLTTFPSKTAPGHAAVWTGSWPGSSGVTSNDVPASLTGEAGALDLRRGFSSEVLRAEPLYVTAALAGRKVVVLSATHHDPPAPHLETLRRAGVDERRLVTFNGFESLIGKGHLYGSAALRPADPAAWGWPAASTRTGPMKELSAEVGESTFHVLAFDDPDDPAAGLDTVLIRQGDRSAAGASAAALLKPRPASREAAGWSPPFRVHWGDFVGNTFFRLFALSGDGSDLVLYQRQAKGLAGAHTPAQLEAYLGAYPGFHDDAFLLYKRGAFGRPLPAGGDGTAELRVLEAAAFDTELVRSGTRFALERWRPDVAFHYSPLADDAGHAWMGVLDPESPKHDPGMAARLWPFYTGILRLLDGWLGEVLDLAGPETIVALVSDHGMEGTGKDVHTNRILEEADLLCRDDNGSIDLGRTLILAADSDFFLRVNDGRFRGGPVRPGDREGVLDRASAALLGARDPETGGRLFTRVWRRRDLAELGLDTELSGDLYLDPAPGYYPDRQLADERVSEQRAWGEGNHGYHPARRKMHALFYVVGPGVKKGVTVPPVRHVDVAPTLTRLLGLPAPAQAVGRPIEALLEP